MSKSGSKLRVFKKFLLCRTFVNHHLAGAEEPVWPNLRRFSHTYMQSGSCDKNNCFCQFFLLSNVL